MLGDPLLYSHDCAARIKKAQKTFECVARIFEGAEAEEIIPIYHLIAYAYSERGFFDLVRPRIRA
jgi:hypothetical protein